MIIKHLTIENFRSYEKEDISFTKGSTLLSGDIGSGKTTILLSIEFALFGLQPGQKGASLLRNGKDDGKVILEFEIDGDDIIIERTLKRVKKSVTQDYAKITINNSVYEESVTEIKNRVLKILNYPQEFSKKTNLLYKFTVYTPQEEMKQIILEPGDLRLNTLRHVFGIDKYKRIEENCSLLTSKLREKIRINEGMTYSIETDRDALNKKRLNLIELKEKQIKANEEYEGSKEVSLKKEKELSEIQEKINEKKSLENEKSKSTILAMEKSQQLKSLQNTINIVKAQIEEAKKLSFNQEEYNAMNARIEFQQNKEDEISKEYIVTLGKITTEETRKKEADLLKNKISALSNCPTCLQTVSSEYKTNIFDKAEQEIQLTEKNLVDLNLKKGQLTEQLNQVKKLKEEFKRHKSELELLKLKLENLKEKEERINDIEKQKQSIEKDIAILNKHIKTIDDSIVEYKKYDTIYSECQKELKESKILENNSAIKKIEIEKEIQFLEKQITEKVEEITKKEEILKETEKIRELEFWLSNKFLDLILFTEKQVMLTLKEEFSKLFSKWFSILVSDSLSAKLDDNFSPIIEHQDYELDYSFLSGGERTAIALAYRLSLNQVINSMLSNIKTNNLVILDEPTDGFSSQQLDKMRDVLSQLNVEQLILVSHEQKIEGFVDNLLRFTKYNDITRIEA